MTHFDHTRFNNSAAQRDLEPYFAGRGFLL
jgi:hypothetical protein